MSVKNVAVLGASSDREKYGNKALRELLSKGHNVFPVNLKEEEIEGVKAYKSIKDIPHEIDTATLYLPVDIIEKISRDIITKKPKRIIFNPGTESPLLMKFFKDSGIEVIEACTLVLLRTGRF